MLHVMNAKVNDGLLKLSEIILPSTFLIDIFVDSIIAFTQMHGITICM